MIGKEHTIHHHKCHLKLSINLKNQQMNNCMYERISMYNII